MGEKEGQQIKISVRSLVEFVLRRGDLDNRRTSGAKKEAMQAGSRLHRKIQKRMGSTYRSEVVMKHLIEEDPCGGPGRRDHYGRVRRHH